MCHAACFSPSRRRSGLRRGVARNRMRTEAGKMPECLIFLIRNGLGVSNDRFGLNRSRHGDVALIGSPLFWRYHFYGNITLCTYDRIINSIHFKSPRLRTITEGEQANNKNSKIKFLLHSIGELLKMNILFGFTMLFPLSRQDSCPIDAAKAAQNARCAKYFTTNSYIIRPSLFQKNGRTTESIK